MKREFKTVDEYIETFPRDVRLTLQKLRQTIHETAPEATEAISYQIPTFKLKGKNLVHFAGWKDHVALYPIPAGDESFQRDVSPYVSGKGTIRLPLDRPIPYDLVEKIVMFRVKETAARKT